MEPEFDLVTIGAGSGGVAASRRAAALGAKVAIVEAGRVGGTCVLRGCVPKKLLMYAAGVRDAFAEAPGFGWEPGASPRFSMARWADAKAAETARLEAVYRRMLEGAGVEIVAGRARLEPDGRTVVVGERRLRARRVLVATGSSPRRDTIPGLEACATSDALLDLRELPARAAIVGGGYIAVEFAAMLARLGVEVSMFYRDRLPLRGFDEMLRTGCAASLAAAGVTLHAGNAPKQVQTTRDGFVLVAADERARDFDWVLNATGRVPNSDGLPLALDARGAIRVDVELQTSLPGVHAVGDVTGRPNLTPVAIAEGRALAERLFGDGHALPAVDRLPSAVFTIPPLATIGPSEDAAAALGRRLEIYESEFRPMREAFVGGGGRTRMKLIVDAADRRVLAVHMIGADAPEIVQSLAVALTAGATKDDFDRTMAVHPTAAEEFVLMREPSRVVGPD